MQYPLSLNVLLALSLLMAYSEYKLQQLLTAPGIIYASLGDSIAYGKDASPYWGYVYQFYRYLCTKCYGLRLLMLARSGLTSRGLLTQLQYSINAKRIISKSSIITISIGGNNLRKSTNRNYTAIDPNLMEMGIKSFSSDWPGILHIIRDVLNSKAVIYVMTLYNPYRFDDPLYHTANVAVQSINSIIKNEWLIEKYKYNVVDVYRLFEKNELKNWNGFTAPKRNPHPNNEGHTQIALLHAEASGI